MAVAQGGLVSGTTRSPDKAAELGWDTGFCSE
jgi:hypothetical protein